mgnify:CR=1 FL=1
MENLKEEVNKMLDIFNAYQIPEEKQKTIITEGVYFSFSYGGIDRSNSNRKFNCFKFSRFLDFCRKAEIELDVNEMLNSPWNSKYEELVHFFDSIDKEAQNKGQQYKK